MANPMASEAARALVAHRRRVTKQCVVCGREFTGPVYRLYDRATCTTVAYKRRKKASKRAQAGSAA
jgi:hypothetical protein